MSDFLKLHGKRIAIPLPQISKVLVGVATYSHTAQEGGVLRVKIDAEGNPDIVFREREWQGEVLPCDFLMSPNRVTPKAPVRQTPVED